LTKQPEKFKARIIYLVPILASILFGMLCATVFVKPSSAAIAAGATPPPVYPVTPISQATPTGSLFNALYFVIIAAIGATTIFLIIRYRGHKTLRFLTGFALTSAFLLVSVIYLLATLSHIPNYLPIVIALSITIAILADLAIFHFGGKAADTVVIGVGGALGVFLGANLNVPTSVLILAFLAVFDIIAVYRGPIGKIAESSEFDEMKGLSFSFKEFQMGLGDLVFYSLLTGTMFINISLAACLFSVIGIMVGSYLTFLALERREVFPGLPIPVALGIAFGLIAGFLL